jgi:hypothetical protein
MLNGHEYVACQAQKKGIDFSKQDNCFTMIPNATDLAKVADTLSRNEIAGRLLQVSERWIYTTCLCFALENSLLRYPLHDRMPCMLPYGLPGMGKTKIRQKFLRDHLSGFDEAKGISCIDVIGIQMPPDADEKRLYEEVLCAAGRQNSLRSHYPADAPHGSRSDDLRRCSNVNHRRADTLLGGSYRQQRILLNAIRFLANDLKLTLVCAGTADAKRALATDRQLADRFRAIELPAWNDDASFHRFLVSFGAALPLQKKSDLLFAPLRRSILEHTEGVLVRIVGLLKELAIEAIQSGRERIDRQSLRTLPCLVPLISMESSLEPSQSAS